MLQQHCSCSYTKIDQYKMDIPLRYFKILRFKALGVCKDYALSKKKHMPI